MRELERQAGNDPEAKLQLARELARLGYQEVIEQFGTLDLTYQAYSIDELVTELNKRVKDKHRQKYHRVQLDFNGSGSCNFDYYDPYDPYPARCTDHESTSVTVTFQGVRMETEKEFKKRVALETKIKEEAKQRRNAQAIERRRAKMQQEDFERETYEKLRRKFETQDKIEKLLVDIGSDAENSLRQYSASYFKSWFIRKSKKLDGKTPLQVYDEGDVETLRLFALKLL